MLIHIQLTLKVIIRSSIPQIKSSRTGNNQALTQQVLIRLLWKIKRLLYLFKRTNKQFCSIRFFLILPKPLNRHLRSISIKKKHRSAKMTKNKIIELVNKDGKLLALFSGLLLDGILLIALVLYVGTRFAF